MLATAWISAAQSAEPAFTNDLAGKQVRLLWEEAQKGDLEAQCCSASSFDPLNRCESTPYHADRRPNSAPNNTLFTAQAIALDLIAAGREKEVQEIRDFISTIVPDPDTGSPPTAQPVRQAGPDERQA